ncbi:hypothetical protein EDB80DRAFT_781752 [Ilyonectria destructans]|nr:hypothetical protein EDB80DRAFT_781752 [Ilyonectria destructans]
MPDHGTLLGPLTTAWSQPASCSIFYAANSDSDDSLSGQRCVNVDRDDLGQTEEDPDCWPPRMRGVKDHDLPLYGWGFYSPGLECPIGYTSACTAISGGQQWQVQFEPGPKETALGCCPKGFSCSVIPIVRAGTFTWAQTCLATSISTDVLYNFKCTGTEHTITLVPTSFAPISGNTDTPTSGNMDTDNGNTVTVTVTDEPKPTIPEPTITLYAPMFQLKFQSTDITITTLASTPLISSSSPPDSTSKSNAGLSTGAKIGIGVGVGIGGILLAALVGWFVLWTKRSKRTLAAELGSSPGRFKDEATPTQVNNPIFSELSGDTHPVELPAHR